MVSTGLLVELLGVLLILGVFASTSTETTTTNRGSGLIETVKQVNHSAPSDALTGGALALGALLILCAVLLPHLKEIKGPGGIGIVFIGQPPAPALDTESISQEAESELKAQLGDDKPSPEWLDRVAAEAVDRAASAAETQPVVWTSTFSPRNDQAMWWDQAANFTNTTSSEQTQAMVRRILEEWVRREST